MPSLPKVKIPEDAYKIAYSICENRLGRYWHRFRCRNKKLQSVGGDDELLKKDIEGVLGYMADMAASQWLGLDHHEEMKSMIIDTDLLEHRDPFDLIYNGWRIDVKCEFLPDDKYKRAIRGELETKETYGCSMINKDHFEQNAAEVDIYLFSTLDDLDPRRSKYFIPFGWMTKEKILTVCPKPLWFSPSGARLWTPTYSIPKSELSTPESLLKIAPAQGAKRTYRKADISDKPKEFQVRYKELIKRVGL